jgi:hypothetical protein
LDAPIAETSSCTPDSYIYFKTSCFNPFSGLFTGDYVGLVDNVFTRILRKERPLLILVIVSALLFLAHQYLQRLMHFNIPFLDNYLDPIVLMPLLLYAVLWERRILLKNNDIELSYAEVLGYFLLVVIFGEIIFPLLSDKFTADYWDILAYAIGTFAYLLVGKITHTQKLKV